MSEPMLQVNHISSGGSDVSPERNARVTINPFALQTVVSSDIEVEGTKLKRVTIFYSDGGILEVNVSTFDAMAIEEAVGSVPAF